MIEKLFPRNEATIERILPVVVGLAVLSLTVIGPKTMWGLVTDAEDDKVSGIPP